MFLQICLRSVERVVNKANTIIKSRWVETASILWNPFIYFFLGGEGGGGESVCRKNAKKHKYIKWVENISFEEQH